MKLKTTLVGRLRTARAPHVQRKITIEVITEELAIFDARDVRARHNQTVDGAHKALRKQFHVQDIRIR